MVEAALVFVATAGAAGMALPVAPQVPPGTVSRPLGADALEIARERYRDGDPAGTTTVLRPVLETKGGVQGRTRSSADLLFGMAQRDLGNWNLASQSFTKVRTSGGPLAPWGAWYEAEMDYQRGRNAIAARECAAYRQVWPDGPHVDACLFLEGDAYADVGQRGASLSAYQKLLEDDPDSPRAESVRLAVALAIAQTSPKEGIPLLQDLAIGHTYHSTAIAAQARLDELAALGMDTKLPDDARSEMRLAESERRCGHLEDAWTRFQALAAKASDDPEVAAWVDANEDRFAWLTRRYEHYATSLLAEYESAPSATTAWEIFNAYRRSGDWKSAAAWGRASIDKYKAAGRWAGLDTEMAWTELLAQEYGESRTRWEKLAKRGGPAGREAQFYAGLSAYMLADPTSAEEHFGAVISAGREWVDGAYYWRMKSRAKAGDTTGSEADRVATIDNDASGWYSLLLDDTPPAESSSWITRDGMWHGPAETTVPSWQKVPTGIPTIGTAPARELEMPTAGAGWGQLTWASLSAPAPSEPHPVAPALPTVDAQVPDGISACSWYDPVAARKLFRDFSDAHADLWPTLPAAYDLAMAGMDEDAGALVHDAIEEWRDARETRTDDPRSTALRAIAVEPGEWRAIALAARDYNHAARLCWGLSRHAETEADRIGALRLEYPIVLGRSVWSYSRAFGVDPLMAMGIMRQESVYLPTALSVSNAMGLVQVLPSTGAKVAALLRETRYTPGDLEVPDTNVRFGIYYMSLLLRRFDGVYPLAVASYNGGPHNVSRLLKGFPDGADIDLFVEHIPMKETRDYVKKVSGHYEKYASIYGPGGQAAEVVVPKRTLGDHPEIVDF